MEIAVEEEDKDRCGMEIEWRNKTSLDFVTARE